jgi:flagellar biogenesis protein FliO
MMSLRCLAVFVASLVALLCSGPAWAQPSAAHRPESSTPLGPARLSGDEPQPASEGAARAIASGWSVAQTILALGFVLSIIVVLGIVVRKVARNHGGFAAALGAGGRSPAGILEVLGRYPMGRGASLVLIKFDRRILLVQQSAGRGLRGQMSMSTLCEVTDAEDVASILTKTRDEEGASMAKRFQEVLSKEDRAFADATQPRPVTIQPTVVEPARSRTPARPALRPAPDPASHGAAAAQAIRSRLQTLRADKPLGVRTP